MRGAGAAILALSVALAGKTFPQAAPARQASRVDYEIAAHVDVETRVLTGTETITWTNRSGEAATDLWFHLYLNAFANNRTTHLVESDGTARGRPFKDSWGWSRVTAVRFDDFQGGQPVDLMPSFRYRRPDEPEGAGNEDDRTVFSVDLPAPVTSGRTVSIEIEWESQLPRVRRRTGYKDDFMLIAQWFPKLGVLQAGRGWNCHQFHASTEFFSDYGTYDVSIDLPAAYEGKVFGSGVRVGTRTRGDRVVTTFAAPSPEDRARPDHTGRKPVVHDFTWTADPDFVVWKRTFSPADWIQQHPEDVAEALRAFGEGRDLGLRDVEVTVLVQPERAEQAERHFDATCAALFYYGLWFGGYPYEHVTVVDPAWGARGAGGMEYPTLFTCGTELFTTPEMYIPESVTVHEAGHQFWYGLVGNNEFESSWLDEGFNSYTDSEVLIRRYGPLHDWTTYSGIPVSGVRAASLPGGGWLTRLLSARKIPVPVDWLPDLIPIRSSGFLDWWRDQPALTLASRWSDPRWHDRTGYLRDPWIDPIDTNAWQYAHRDSYRTNSYQRPAVVLRTLSGLVGREPFLRGMRHYAETWRYGHPTPDDFFASFQEGSGLDEDLGWYFDEMFRGTGTGDWSVAVEQEREPKPKGWFQEGETGPFVEVKADDGDDDGDEIADDEADEDPQGDEDEADDDGKDDRPWRIEVLLQRQGELRLPMPVRLTFGDDTVQELVWTREEQGASRWKKLELTSAAKLESVVVDPEHLYWVDGDMSNNQWHDDVDEVAPKRWSERVFSQFAHLLHWQARIGG